MSKADEFDWIKVKQELDSIQNEEKSTAKFRRKMNENPLVPIGCLLTASALVYGLISFRRGDSKTSQLMMRCRIVAQGFTVVALLGGLVYSATNSAKATPAQPSDGGSLR